VANSSIFEDTGTGYVGVGTPTPQASLNLLGANPTMRIDNYGPAGSGDSPNFNFYTANGSSAANATGTLNGDNLGQFAAYGYVPGATPGTGAFTPSSRVKVEYIATENWSPTANGTAMTFQTTTNGTTARNEWMRLDNTGYLGIGTTAPDQMLTVAGNIHATGILQADSGVPAASISGTIGDSQISAISGAKVTGTVVNATNAATAANSGNLNGLPPTSYARTDVGNSLNGTQAITGNATVSGDVTAATFHGNGAALTGLSTTVPASALVHLTTYEKANVLPAVMTQLHQYISGGTFGPPYVVPAGQNLVITSIEVGVTTAGNNYLNLYDNTTIGQNEYWYLPNVGTTQLQFPSGIVYPAGTGVYVYIGGAGTTQMIVDVHGYLTAN
jgi:hypothetical protein